MNEIIEFLLKPDSTADQVRQTIMLLLIMIWTMAFVVAMFMEAPLNKEDDMDIYGRPYH